MRGGGYLKIGGGGDIREGGRTNSERKVGHDDVCRGGGGRHEE